MKIELGSKVRDKITGIEGIAVARTSRLHGCERICIQPKVGTDGRVPDDYTTDEPNVEVVEGVKVVGFISSHGDRENVDARPNVQ